MFKLFHWPELSPQFLVSLLFGAGLWVGLIIGLSIGERLWERRR